MAGGWIDGFVRVNAASGSSGSYINGYPVRIVFHTTEILSDPRQWIPNWGSPSQIVLDYERDLAVQVLNILEGGKSLENRAGGVETNRMPCVQIEINARSEEVPTWSDAKYRWIARKVAAIVLELKACGVQVEIDPNTVPLPGAIPNSARVNAPQRLSDQQWLNLSSACGHRHVPENEHWDAGLLDMRLIMTYVVQELHGQIPSNPTNNGLSDYEDNTFMYVALRTSNGVIFLTNLATGKTENLLDTVMPRLASLGIPATMWKEHLINLRDAGLLKPGAAGPELLWSNITDDVFVGELFQTLI